MNPTPEYRGDQRDRQPSDERGLELKAEFPALYAAADEAANSAQSRLLSLSRLNIALLVSASLLTAAGSNSQLGAVLGATIFSGSLALLVYLRVESFQKKWYQARALAESVKTATWRFVCEAEPFNSAASHSNLQAFGRTLEELLRDNKSLGDVLGGSASSAPQVTPWMSWMGKQTLEIRKAAYLSERIRDQRGWYARKASENRSASRNTFVALVAIYAAAIVLHLLKVGGVTIAFWPIAPITVLAAGVISWRQLKRFDELASAYALTAHEVGIIESRFALVSGAESFGRFVADAENAFSREHTQWAARRDH
jgi:hypothetical protein